MRISDWSSDVCSSDLIYRCQRAAIVDHPASDVYHPFGYYSVDEVPARKVTRNSSFGSPVRDRVDDSFGHDLGFNRRHALSEWHTGGEPGAHRAGQDGADADAGICEFDTSRGGKAHRTELACVVHGHSWHR